MAHRYHDTEKTSITAVILNIAYSNLSNAAESFARDFSKNQTKNSDNTAQTYAT